MELLYVNKPKVDNDTVSYSWNFSHEQEIFKRNQFYIKYEGVDLTSLDSTVFYEIFVSLMIPILRESKREYLIMLPEGIPAKTAGFWLNYNETDNVSVYPLTEEPAILQAKRKKAGKKIGILFGGGKDSLYAYHLNKEIFGKDNMLVISFTFPMDMSQKNKLDERRDNFALNHIRNDGVSVQKVITDFRSIFKTYSYFNATHTQLYYSMCYPLYGEHNLSYLTYSYEFTHYWNIDQQGNTRFNFKKSRAEFDAFLSQYFTERFSRYFKVFNSNYYVSENSAFQLLKQRYGALEDLMMCEAVADPTVKWCTKCKKCGEYVLYSLANRYESNEIDFNAFLTESDFMKKLIVETEAKQENRNGDGNVSWYNGLITPLHYMSFCHMIHSIDLSYWADKLNEPALEAVKKLKSWFGNKSYDILDHYLPEAVKALDLPFEHQLLAILKESLNPLDEERVEILYADTKVKMDLTLEYPIESRLRNNITDQIVSEAVLKARKPAFNDAFSSKARAYNQADGAAVPYVYEEDYRGYVLYIDKSAPKKGDTAEVTFQLGNLDKNKTYHLTMNVLAPYKSDQYKNRFNYIVSLDQEVSVQEDISDWDNDNMVNIIFNPKASAQTVTIKVETTKNCEAWNWGRAAQLVIKDVRVACCPTKTNNHISVSSPFSKISEWSNQQ